LDLQGAARRALGHQDRLSDEVAARWSALLRAATQTEATGVTRRARWRCIRTDCESSLPGKIGAEGDWLFLGRFQTVRRPKCSGSREVGHDHSYRLRGTLGLITGAGFALPAAANRSQIHSRYQFPRSPAQHGGCLPQLNV
jgi:hypothetical protein